MKNLKLLSLFVLTIIVLNCSENTNKNNDEQEIRNLIAQYDDAALKNDISFFETNFASDYQIATYQGEWATKEEQLKYLKEEMEEPTHKLVALKSDSIQVHFIGDAAIVSGKWLSTIQLLNDPSAVMHHDEGRYTSILEKRNGKWMMIREHASQKPHNKQELETQLKAASESYDKGLVAKDKMLFEDLFAEDYTATGREGKITNKVEEITGMMSPDVVYVSSKTDDKNFRLYRDTAVETGRFAVSGSYKGEPFSEVGRYTTTWIYRDGKWKIVADHTSLTPDSE